MSALGDILAQLGITKGGYGAQYGQFGGASSSGYSLTKDNTWQSNLNNLFTAGPHYMNNQYGAFHRDPARATQGVIDIFARDFLSDRSGSALQEIVDSWRPERERLGAQLPGLEQSLQTLISGKGTSNRFMTDLDAFGKAYIEEYAKPGGVLSELTMQGLGAGIQGGEGPRGGRQERAGYQIANRFNDEFARELVLQAPQLRSVGEQERSTSIQGLLNLLGVQSGRYDQLGSDIYTGTMNTESWRMGQGTNLINALAGKENIEMNRKAFKESTKGGGFLGGLGRIAGGVLGAAAGPIGSALGASLGGSLFGGNSSPSFQMQMPTSPIMNPSTNLFNYPQGASLGSYFNSQTLMPQATNTNNWFPRR
jgi:hypothetical protein